MTHFLFKCPKKTPRHYFISLIANWQHVLLQENKRLNNWFTNNIELNSNQASPSLFIWHLCALEILRPRFVQSSQRVAHDKAFARVLYDHDHRMNMISRSMFAKLFHYDKIGKNLLYWWSWSSEARLLCSSFPFVNFYSALSIISSIIHPENINWSTLK